MPRPGREPGHDLLKTPGEPEILVAATPAAAAALAAERLALAQFSLEYAIEAGELEGYHACAALERFLNER